MRLLVTGATGQVGWELARSLMPLGEVISLDRSSCNLSRPETVAATVSALRPNVIVNAAAYTTVDKAEQEETLATTINGTSVGVLAEAARKSDALLVHYSTDYVFDGTKDAPYIEADAPHPLNAYGRSKLAGEVAIRESACAYVILRTSWVYAARGHNFVRTILRLARERDELGIVADQIGAPTSARFIADATAHIINRIEGERAHARFVPGIFHLTASGSTSWHGFAEAIVGIAGRYGLLDRNRALTIKPIPTSAYPQPAMRPRNSRLDCGAMKDRFNIHLAGWKCLLEKVIRDLAGG